MVGDGVGIISSVTIVKFDPVASDAACNSPSSIAFSNAA